MLGALVHSEEEAEREAVPPVETLASKGCLWWQGSVSPGGGPPGQEAGSEGTQVSFVGAYISELEADGF